MPDGSNGEYERCDNFDRVMGCGIYMEEVMALCKCTPQRTNTFAGVRRMCVGINHYFLYPDPAVGRAPWVPW